MIELHRYLFILLLQKTGPFQHSRWDTRSLREHLPKGCSEQCRLRGSRLLRRTPNRTDRKHIS